MRGRYYGQQVRIWVYLFALCASSASLVSAFLHHDDWPSAIMVALFEDVTL